MYQVPDDEGGAKDVAAQDGTKGKKVSNVKKHQKCFIINKKSKKLNKSFSQIFQENAS